ncbi:PREDICTED: uncharacterized protein LOC104699698 [Camelina sativa]|uniref:Uncharacterized protein LOC104699698 n=1 Tax=Camelina sativa TaxID=90675 RepID=A0ABM1Q7X8_CAMSA|nr:PREDICTED: uncharacterized protein LOC104699698 [Camelina sativa]
MGIDEENKEAMMMITSKLQHVLAAKSRRLQFMSSPLVKNHVSPSSSHLSSSSPNTDDSFSRASVPFSWEEEPGKPKHRILHPSYSKCLDLPPRMLLPGDFAKMHLTEKHRRRLAGWKRWFRLKKERDGEGHVAGKSRFVYQSDDEDEDDMKTYTRTTGGLDCFSYVTSCYFWEVPWKNNKLQKYCF